MPVRFSYADIPPVYLIGKRMVKLFISEIFKREGKDLRELTYVFCTDEFLLQVNRDFLQHDYYTDIITFDLSEANIWGTIGEVYISIDRVRENASHHQTTFSNELLRVLFHGALHLCGYGDKTKREITIMREKEDEYLRIFEKHTA